MVHAQFFAAHMHTHEIKASVWNMLCVHLTSFDLVNNVLLVDSATGKFAWLFVAQCSRWIRFLTLEASEQC